MTILDSITERDMESLAKRSRMLTRDMDSAADLLHDAFVKALELDHAGKYRGRRDSSRVKFIPGVKRAQGSPASFVNGILGGLCMNRRRMNTGRAAILSQLRSNIEARGGRRTPARATY